MGQIENFDVELNEIDIDGAAYIVPIDENFKKLKAAAEALKEGVEGSSDANHTHKAEEVGAFPAAQGKTLQENVGDISDKLFSHWWKKKKLEQVISVDTTKASISLLNALNSPSATTTVYYADSFSSTADSKGYLIYTLSNPQAVTFSYDNCIANAAVLRGKYVVVNDGSVVYYIDEASKIEQTIMNDKYYVFFDAYKASIEETYIDYGYASSNSADTYSQGQNNDGYYYEYLGIPFENARESAKIQTGSYVGTGTGFDTPVIIPADFKVKFAVIWREPSISETYRNFVELYTFINPYPHSNAIGYNGNQVGVGEWANLIVDWGQKGISWTANIYKDTTSGQAGYGFSESGAAEYMANLSGKTYYYFLIG